MTINLSDVCLIRQTEGEQRQVLGPISFSIKTGELLAIVGASGCGKTSLLNIVAGLEKGYQGTLVKDPEHHYVSYMFQDTSLLPWRSIRKNLRLGFEIMRKAMPCNVIEDVIDSIGLVGYGDSPPEILSGGMKRRAYLAQNIICDPDLLLLDEPFTGLDYLTKKAMRIMLMEQHQSKTIIMATHDIEDAILLSDRIVVLTGKPTVVARIVDVASIHNKGLEYLEIEHQILEIFDAANSGTHGEP